MAIATEADVAQKMAEALVHRHAPETQASGHEGALLTRIPTIDEVLNAHATALRDDFVGYRNHVYRVANLCVAIAGPRELEKIAVAAVFHDLGIWTNGTFDYIAPSIALAHDYLVARAREDWTAEIEGMIANHHKITTSSGRSGFARRGIPARRLDRRDTWTQRVRHSASVRCTPVRNLAGCRVSLASRHVDARIGSEAIR